MTDHPFTLDEFISVQTSPPTVYIAGPMSGIPEYNFPAFRDAAVKLRNLGLIVVSPVEMDEDAGFDAATHHPNISAGDGEWSSFLARDVGVVADPHTRALVVLDGWDKSRGAALETYIARELGKPVYRLSDGELVKHPSDVKPPSAENIAEEAVRLVQPGGDRHENYGHPLDDFTRSAQIITAILGHEVRADQIPLIMIAVKMSRICQTPTKRDSWVDIVGYALTGEMALAKLDNPLK